MYSKIKLVFQARIDLLSWTGKAFVRSSGASRDVFVPSACAALGILKILSSFEPQSGFNTKECKFSAVSLHNNQPNWNLLHIFQGNYTAEIDWDENLHENGDQQSYDPIKLNLTILEGPIMLFGFTIQLTLHDLNLYKFIPKD